MWVTPPTRRFCYTYTNMLVSKNAEICVTPNANFKIALAPTQNPNASHWNIGCVGYQTQNLRVGHEHFMFFVLISFAFGSQRKPSFQWNMGYSDNLVKWPLLPDSSAAAAPACPLCPRSVSPSLPGAGSWLLPSTPPIIAT